MMSTDHHEGINYMNRSDLNLENLNNNIYYKNNTKYVELIIDIICNHPYNFSRMLKTEKYDDVYQWVFSVLPKCIKTESFRFIT